MTKEEILNDPIVLDAIQKAKQEGRAEALDLVLALIQNPDLCDMAENISRFTPKQLLAFDQFLASLSE